MYPDWWTQELFLERVLHEILLDQKIIKANQEKIMSKLTDLQDAIAEAQTDVTSVQTNLEAFIEANSGGASDAQLATLTTAVQGISTTAKAINDVLNPPPTVAPTA